MIFFSVFFFYKSRKGSFIESLKFAKFIRNHIEKEKWLNEYTMLYIPKT
jgi:hypothetical protein